VIIHGSTGDMPGIEMRGGTLVIGGDCTRPGANMIGGTCVVLGKADRIIPTFLGAGVRDFEWGDHTYSMRVYQGDLANRGGKGTLLVKLP
jgi:formylmethanofuran dehydrogenase subunit C